jgi:hypothetical protein
MEIYDAGLERYLEDYGSVDGSIDLVLEGTDGLLAELENMRWTLPTVGPWDQFHPLFRDNAHSQEEAIRAKLQEKLRTLRRFESVIDKEIERCKRNLGRISSDAAHLRLNQPRRLYSEAENAQAAQYEKASKQEEKVKKMIARAQNAMSSAPTSWYRREIPQWQPQIPGFFEPASTSQSIFSKDSRNGFSDPLAPKRYVPAYSNEIDRTFDDELVDLLSLGPLKKSGLQK